ncbi:hypothetical protein AKJ41_00005 [candidate division MSBL1 archaeon SCGC-AAA259O05]|uniref:THUMP domain-containing protein n=1 Tax=candidate division MSBL1 archaeon SCGC-AAA259O05 TaxID=1698271 RepID=A0A133V5S6_9EURY|nr:hypothetical protein AKJ41_00005 [candidate division MSBL1 archaeon SCGC-AAA259O05]
MEKIVCSRIQENFEKTGNVVPKPSGFMGIVISEICGKKKEEIKEIPEVENVVPIVEEVSQPNLEKISKLCRKVAEELPDGSRFAVDADRRGTHEFTSQEIEAKAGSEIMKLVGSLEVELDRPDFVVKVEVIEQWAGVGILEGGEILRKKVGKADSRELTAKIHLVQLVYRGKDRRGIERIGVSLGRSAQAFETKKVTIVFDSPTDADKLQAFLNGIDEGIDSRFRIQKRVYERSMSRVPVDVYELYQFLRKIDGEEDLVIMTDPRGEVLQNSRNNLKEDLKSAETVYLFNGSNKGIPTGCFERADHVLDLAPHITYATDQAITASVIALLNL